MPPAIPLTKLSFLFQTKMNPASSSLQYIQTSKLRDAFETRDTPVRSREFKFGRNSMRWSGGDATKREKEPPRFNKNRFKGEHRREPQRKHPCPLALLRWERGRCRFWQPRRGLSLPLCCRPGLGWGVPARRRARGGPQQGPGWLCLCVCVTRLLVTEPFSSAREMSVVTELRPTTKKVLLQYVVAG